MIVLNGILYICTNLTTHGHEAMEDTLYKSQTVQPNEWWPHTTTSLHTRTAIRSVCGFRGIGTPNGIGDELMFSPLPNGKCIYTSDLPIFR